LKEKVGEKKRQEGRLSELIEERQIIEKNIEECNREYDDFKKFRGISKWIKRFGEN
jgi:hypothetical protein